MSTVQTVLGAVDPKLLGRVLTHEHMSLEFNHFYCAPPDDLKQFFNRKITLENVGFVRQYPYSCEFNMHFWDAETHNAVEKDVALFKKLGGGTIVENTSHGLRRNLELMYDISSSTGVHVVAGTGHYVHSTQSDSTLQMKIEDLTDMYSKEIISGFETKDKGMIKCGFIGEVGSTWPIHDFEKHCIMATGEIQDVLKCGVSFHPGRDAKAPFEIMRLYLEAGGNANKCIMSHLDRTLDIDEVLEFSKFGTYMQYDLFGTQASYYQLNPDFDMISDAQRINNVIKLVAEGLEDRILISHDIHTKHRLTSFGGHGYSHIHSNILPRLYGKGLTIDQVEKITVTNPATWLAFSV